MLTIILLLLALGAGATGITVAVVKSRQPDEPITEDKDPIFHAVTSTAFQSGDFANAFKVGIVGEADHQANINMLASRGEGRDFTAILSIEPDKSVSVVVSGLAVGHFSKPKAAQYVKAVHEQDVPDGALVAVPLRIMGGHKLPSGAVGNYGVKLDMAWPVKFPA